jgi:hypothetical protein
MSRFRAVAFVCFMASMIVVSPKSQVSAAFKCEDQEVCNEFVACGGNCTCTCDGYNPWPFNCYGGPPPSGYSDGFCLIPISDD